MKLFCLLSLAAIFGTVSVVAGLRVSDWEYLAMVLIAFVLLPLVHRLEDN